MASSEDERPWPTAPSFGSLPRKENSVPGLGGGIWSTHKRDSFKMEKAAQRNAAREARLAAPNQTRSGLRSNTTPSPAASEGSGALPFSIPLQPAPKAGRSMSHSQGQREVPQVTGNHTNGSDHATVLPLGLLAEEVDTELESELGGGLTHTTSHPPIGSLQRTSTYPSTYDSFYPSTNGKGSGQASGGAQSGFKADRAFGTAFADLTLGKLPLSFLPSNFPHRRLTDAPAHLQITHNAELSGRHISAGTTYQTSTNHVAIHSQTFPRVAVPPLKQASGRKWAEEASGQLDLICTIGPADPLKSKSSIVETVSTMTPSFHFPLQRVATCWHCELASVDLDALADYHSGFNTIG